MSKLKVIARDLSFSALLVAAFLSAVLAIELIPAPDGAVTVITAPFAGRNAVEVIAAAEGNILEIGRWPWIAVAIHSGNPDFQQRLRAAGALFLMPPITNACLKSLALEG